MALPCDPVPIEVRDSRGRWHGGFWLLRFLPDGTVAVRSHRTGQIRHLPLDQWRDPIEEVILRAAGRPGDVHPDLGRRLAPEPPPRCLVPMDAEAGGGGRNPATAPPSAGVELRPFVTAS